MKPVAPLPILFAALLIMFGLSGCAGLQPVGAPAAVDEPTRAEPGVLPTASGWWYASFEIDWPEGESIDWYMGTLIGGEVVAPLLDEYSSAIQLWRVHRRAVRDTAGHRFSFIFYSSPETAQRIYTAIENNATVKSMLENGRLVQLKLDDVRNNKRPAIEDTSDPSWSLPVQKRWPALIMGASRMWLDLVTDYAAEEGGAGDLEARYKNVQARMTATWQDEGQHAVLHHLSGIFAYQPLLIRY